MPLHVYRIGTDKDAVIDWVIAESEEDAREVQRAYYLDVLKSDHPPIALLECVQEADEDRLAVDDVLSTNSRGALTCAEWAALEGRGFLCSTDW